MVERQLPKLHTGVRFPSPALLPMETGLKTPFQSQRQNAKPDIVQFCRSIPDVPLSQWETGGAKDFTASDFCSEAGLSLARWRVFNERCPAVNSLARARQYGRLLAAR